MLSALCFGQRASCCDQLLHYCHSGKVRLLVSAKWSEPLLRPPNCRVGMITDIAFAPSHSSLSPAGAASQHEAATGAGAAGGGTQQELEELPWLQVTGLAVRPHAAVLCCAVLCCAVSCII